MIISHNITEGLSTIYSKVIDTTDVGSEHGSGALDFMLSTPAIMTMVVDASADMLDHLLPEDFITVTKSIEATHEKPTMIGETVTLIITVDKLQDDRILLSFTGHDTAGVICKGTHKRVVVNRQRLIDAAYQRSDRKLPKLDARSED